MHMHVQCTCIYTVYTINYLCPDPNPLSRPQNVNTCPVDRIKFNCIEVIKYGETVSKVIGNSFSRRPKLITVKIITH